MCMAEYPSADMYIRNFSSSKDGQNPLHIREANGLCMLPCTLSPVLSVSIVPFGYVRELPTG